LGGRRHIGVHIAQADGVVGLTAVETPLLCQDHPIVEAEGVDDAGRTQPEVVVPTTIRLSQPSSGWYLLSGIELYAE
jgi:hypothetical protein